LSSVDYSGRTLSICPLPNGDIFIAHIGTSNYRLYGIVCSIEGTTITKGNDTTISSTNGTGYAISACLLPDNRVFIAHSYTDNYALYGIICNISGTTISYGTDTALINSNYMGLTVSTLLLPSGNIFVAFGFGKSLLKLGSIIAKINDNTITVGTYITISSTSFSAKKIATNILANGRVLVINQVNGLSGVVCSIEDTTISFAENTNLIKATNAGYEFLSILLINETIFISHSRGAEYYLYAQIFGIDYDNNIPTNHIVITEYEQQVTPAIQPPFNAVALSSGVGGTDTEHNEQVKIARPKTLRDFDLVTNGDFSNGLEGWNSSSGVSTSVTEGVASFWNPSYNAGASGITQTINKQLIQNHIYYICVDGKAPSEISGDVYAVVVFDIENMSMGNLTKDDNWHTLSMLYTADQIVVVKSIQLLIYNGGAIATYWDNVKMIDLTEMYGAGNEPTKEWCDANLGGEA
jgi:hypothetical protein